MSVRVVPLTCPSCGGRIRVPEGTKRCFCMYCGTQIAIDDGSIHLHTYDEAELKRVELEREERAREQAALEKYEARRHNWVLCVLGWAVALGVSLVLTAIMTDGPANDAVSLAAGSVLVFGPIVLIVARPKHPQRKRR